MLLWVIGFGIGIAAYAYGAYHLLKIKRERELERRGEQKMKENLELLQQNWGFRSTPILSSEDLSQKIFPIHVLQGITSSSMDWEKLFGSKYFFVLRDKPSKHEKVMEAFGAKPYTRWE